jgi:HrpA-like RNA helicase
MATPNYQRLYSQRKQLPIFAFRARLLEAIDANQVIVVVGETGSGKTTQLPQYLLEHKLSSDPTGQCFIVCSEPRRISAIRYPTTIAFVLPSFLPSFFV